MKDRIRQLCKKKGVRASQVEADLNLSKGYISKLDKTNPNLAKLKLLADYFGVTVEYLANGNKGDHYYLNDETAQIAQEVFDNPNQSQAKHLISPF